MGMSEFQTILTSRRTVHRFSEQPVSDEHLTLALEAANQAPCHKHTHPWRFYVMGTETREKLTPTVAELAKKKSRKTDPKDVENDVKRAVAKMMSPPVMVAITSKRNPTDGFREKEDYAATVCALHNMVLSFWGNGVAAKWSTGAITRHSETYAHLKIDATAEEIIGFVKAGYPETIPEVRKPPVEEHTVRLP